MNRKFLLPVVWAAVIVLLAAVLPWIVQNYSESDNVRELFRTDRKYVLPPHTWFLLLCLLVPTSAGKAARLLLRGRVVTPILIAVCAPVVGWYCLRFAVTVESVHDILGGPVPGLPYDFGYIARFSVVFGGLWLVTLLGFLPELRSANIETRGSAAPSGVTESALQDAAS